MQTPKLSQHFAKRKPSAIRAAQIEFMKRTDGTQAVNTAIGNVSLPMHPAMRKRMFELGKETSPFKNGVVKYSATIGTKEAADAVLHIIASSGLDTSGLFAQITDGGSAAMELMILGTCGPAGTEENPLLLIDAAYTNYKAIASRLGRKTVSVTRILNDNGKFTIPDIGHIEKVINNTNPGALLLIPYDNPTGHYYDHQTMCELCRIAVKHNMWIVSDEAYRELYYTDGEPTSVFRVTDLEVPGIIGRRISIETASKVWNACGLRIGSLVTDNLDFHEKSVAEYTANLCSNVLGQYIFAALAGENFKDLQKWYEGQRKYYKDLLFDVRDGLLDAVPGLIVSSPDASIYSVIDVRNVAKPGFSAQDFVFFCASQGKVNVEGKNLTLLTSPMAGFYNVKDGDKNPGQTQMRISYVDTKENMALVPALFAKLFTEYESRRK